MARTVKEIEAEIVSLFGGVGDIGASAKKYEGALKKLELTADGLEADYKAELKKLEAEHQKAQADAKKSYQIKIRSLATSNSKEMVQIQADAKLCRMAAESLGKLISELKSAKGDDNARKVAEAKAAEARRSYAALSTKITGLEAMVRKVESACKP